MRTRIQRKGIYFYCYAESVWRSLEPSVKCGRSGSTPPSQCRFLRPTLSCLGCGPSLYICAFTTVPQVQGLHSQPHIHTQRTLITSLCPHSFKDFPPPSPGIAELVEHLTVDLCSNQMVPGSIPEGRIFGMRASNDLARAIHTHPHTMMIADDRTCLCFVSLQCLCVY